MPEDRKEPGVLITMRDIYDSVHELREDVTARMDRHEANDSERFSNLNVKFYGVLAALAAAATTVIIQVVGLAK